MQQALAIEQQRQELQTTYRAGQREFVVGFLFDDAGENVVLIEKSKPAWQKDKLNGVGGAIEPGESPLAAMIREFEEETGVIKLDWNLFAVLDAGRTGRDEALATPGNPGAIVYFFRSFGKSAQTFVRSMTAERVLVCGVANALDGIFPIVPNLRWLIPMALSMEQEMAARFDVMEVMKPPPSIPINRRPPSFGSVEHNAFIASDDKEAA